jgi:hypothetical protein
MDYSKLIAALNALDVGEISGLRAKLAEARQACVDLDQDGLAEILTEAEEALSRADLSTYRKRVETAIARMGHLR